MKPIYPVDFNLSMQRYLFPAIWSSSATNFLKNLSPEDSVIHKPYYQLEKNPRHTHSFPELQTILLEMTQGKSQSRKDSQAWPCAFCLPDLGSLDIPVFCSFQQLSSRTIMKPQTLAKEV